MEVKNIKYKAALEWIKNQRGNVMTPHDIRFCISVVDDSGEIRGAAILGRPRNEGTDNGATLEMIPAFKTKNDGIFLYNAAARACFALGYSRIITFTGKWEYVDTITAAGYERAAEYNKRIRWQKLKGTK